MKNNKQFYVSVVANVVLFMLPYVTGWAESTVEVRQAIAQAEAARAKADGVGGEWRDTADMIKQAEEAAAKDDTITALRVATEAKLQGELGYIQATKQQRLEFPAYFK